jgi:type IV pilus assembly protein PilE
MKRARGFTLIELMIVVAIVALLAAIAYPIYTKQMRKGRRAEARQVLVDMSLRQEKWRTDHATYGTIGNIGSPGNQTYYNVELTAGSNTATGYTFTATPKGDQAKDSCGTLTLKMVSGVVSKLPNTTDCW